ncbi:MAG: hypothetical protein ABJN69_02820 [Hellea sp.]
MTILPQIKYSILPAMLLSMAAPQISFAQSSSPLSGLYACEAVSGDAAQLACFRAATAKLRASETLGGSVAAERERLANEKESLALERQRLAAERESLADAKKPEFSKTPAFSKSLENKPEAPKSQTVAITKTQILKGSGYVRFTLANGEVWQQTEPENVRLGRASPDVLVVKKRRIGGYLGKVNDRRPSFSVKRVK